MAEFDYDLFVIGGGSGGVRAGRMASEFGARVAVAEAGRFGGTCVNVGCVPKKFLVYAAQVAHEVQDAAGFGWRLEPGSHDWSTLMANKDRAIERLNGIYASNLEKAGAEILRGRAHLRDAYTVEVEGKAYTARHILVAAGGMSSVPSVPGAELMLTSDDMFALKERPRRIAIGGGGYIAVEFASIMNMLGSEVTLIHRRDQVLRGFDQDVRAHMTALLAEQGIRMALSRTIASIAATEEGARRVRLDDGSELEVDAVLCAMGRKPRTKGLGLEEAGVELDDAEAVIVDDYSRTMVPHIFAVGDVTNRINLTPVAIHEGAAVAQTLFNNNPTRPDHRDVPSAVFTTPSVACVGMTEEEARKHYGRVRIYRSSFRELKHSISGRNQRALAKLIVAADTDRVVGMHMVGEHAGEVVQGFAVAIKMGATKGQFDQTLAIHPTAAEEFVTLRTPSE